MKNILFIGNSYTYVNDMPHIFADIARSVGVDVNVCAVTNGGWTLEKHADINDTYGSAVDAVLKGRKFDIVIMQEQSIRPAAEPEAFRTAVEKLIVKVRENGASPYFYSTWGRKEGSQVLADNGWTHEEMTKKLAASYEVVGREFGISVAYAGLAFYDVNLNHPEIDLYTKDLSHPSKYGSFLAALTLFAKIFEYDVSQIAYNYEFSDDEAQILKNAVKKQLG